MIKIIYKPTFNQLENGKFTVSCIILNEKGEKIENFSPPCIFFDSQDQADNSMREYLERRGYLVD